MAMMVQQEPEHRYIVVVDTEQYAGNFERDLCAYCTGEIGDCGVGDRYAKMYGQEVSEAVSPFGCGSLDHRADDSDVPCRRPCAIWPTPGWYCNGQGGIEKGKIPTKANTDPAYLSVAIFFYDKPNEAQISMIKSRARKFPEVWRQEHPERKRPDITITGFRLIDVTTTYTETKL